MIAERYRDGLAATWDEFVRTSRNGTFLFLRGYMDYHRDRFPDHSLIVWDEASDPLAVLPAHASGNRIISHGGLSYGGFLIGSAMKTPAMLGAFEAAVVVLRDLGFATLEYKTVPAIYHRQSAEEDRYALFLLGADLVRRDLLSVVSRHDRLPYQMRRARGVKRARAHRVTVHEEHDIASFWDLLSDTLRNRFGSAPVHTPDEITLLKERFPDNIRFFAARSAGGELVAGVVVYESERVAHAQYIAASPAGREVSALDLVFDHLLNVVYRDHPYFDFGGSHEDGGRAVNEGLIDQKEGFGARAVAHDHYRIDLTAVQPGILTGALR